MNAFLDSGHSFEGFAGLNGSPLKSERRTSSEISSPTSPFSPSTDRGDEMTGVSDVEAIRVVCRFRPQSDIELAHDGESCVQFEDDHKVVSIQAEGGLKTFQFSRVFNDQSSQEDVYNYSAKPMVQDVLNGCSASIIAYGQTGAGKTYTMQGPGFDDPLLREKGYEGLMGIIPRVMQDIFRSIAAAPVEIQYEVSASYLEIYQEKLRDLLSAPRGESHSLALMDARSKGLVVPDARQVPVFSAEEIISIMRLGAKNRRVAATNANDESSRSHAIFLVTVTRIKGGTRRCAQLYLVDLAGSEKVSKTLAEGQRLSEAKYINKSLLTLGNVIHALVKKKKYVPYRDSKLTRLLKNSLGGNAKTTLIINCSPSSYNAGETLSTLRFGDRTSRITNVIKINEQRSPEVLEALLTEKEQENEELRKYILHLESEVGRLNRQQQNGMVMYNEEREKGKEKELIEDDDDEKDDEDDVDGYSFETPNRSKTISVVGEAMTPLRPAALFGPTTPASEPIPHRKPAKTPLDRKHPATSVAPASTSRLLRRPKRRRNTMGGIGNQQGAEDEDSDMMGKDYFLEVKKQMEKEHYEFKRDMSKKDMMNFLCPLTRMVFKDPVVCMDGHTYERDAIEAWLKRHTKSPLTGNKLTSRTLLPNYNMKRLLAFKRQVDPSFSILDLFSLLPFELLMQIFEYLDYLSLMKCEQVCTNFRDVLKYEGLWKRLLVRDYKEDKEPTDVMPKTLREYYSAKERVRRVAVKKRVTEGRLSQGITLFKT